MKTLILAAAIFGIAAPGFAPPAAAAEGLGNPFPFETTAGTRLARQATAPDVGSSQYPDIIGRPGSNLPRLAAATLPANGSEGAVQTANSLPLGAEEGTVIYAQAQSVNRWMTAHTQPNTIRTASR